MSVEQNDVRRFCERFAALYSAHDLDGLMAMYAEDAEFQVVDQPEPLRGRTAIRQYLQAQFDAFPDVHVELGTILVDGSSFADEGLVNRHQHRRARSAER
jgi:ketosteroid isomerase-like protein